MLNTQSDLQTFKSVTRAQSGKINILFGTCPLDENALFFFLQKPVNKKRNSPSQTTFHLLAPKMTKKSRTLGVNNGLWAAAQSFYDMIEGLGVKTHSYILTIILVTFKKGKTSYLTHRHAAHAGVQHARPGIGAHFTDEWEPLLPVDTVEMDWLPLEEHKQPFRVNTNASSFLDF